MYALKIKKFCYLFSFLSISYTAISSEPFCDLETGMIGCAFKKQLEVANIQPTQFFDEFPNHHILNVATSLQKNGCFQKDFEFYKNGNRSDFILTFEQAQTSLNLDDQSMITKMPRYTPNQAVHPVDLMIVGGVLSSFYENLRTLQYAINQGYKFHKIHFLFRESDQKNLQQAQDNPEFESIFKENDFDLYTTQADIDTTEDNIKNIKNKDSLSSNYVIVTRPPLDDKVESIFDRILNDRSKCLGVVSLPAKPWAEKMKDFGYLAAFEDDFEKSTIAWASSSWNFKARQLYAEATKYIQKHNLPESYLN